ncbi:hypothetical protein [Xanthomonas maliensis]|uniref:hypothetical protein n=1 Tax=Xanthomonas maliensis TaxID=1321368 RepID=UPI0014782958|nr:hypothetical protein [Xanthomonas maliensis]
MANSPGDAAGYAARGAKLELGEENPKKKGYFAIKRVVSGTYRRLLEIWQVTFHP